MELRSHICSLGPRNFSWGQSDSHVYAGWSSSLPGDVRKGTEEQRDLARMMIERGWAGRWFSPNPMPIRRRLGSDQGPPGRGNTYHLEGVKRFFTGGEHDATEKIVHLVLARPDGAGTGTKGIVALHCVPSFS